MKTPRSLVFLVLFITRSCAFLPSSSSSRSRHIRFLRASSNDNDNNIPETSSYQDTDGASKGLVSSLTGLVNSLSNSNTQNNAQQGTSNSKSPPPTSPQELLRRIRDDYVVNNYLWTGNLDIGCFQNDCRFTDPTLTFQGTDTFTKNTQNLVPLVEAFCENYESNLLDIELQSDPNDPKSMYIQSRWNMVGELNGLFWKPKIDVIGRTKFWFHQDDACQVFFYDEEWEIPAYQALLQLVTPAGTIPNSSRNPQGAS
jgi:hypothetical protein